MYDGSAHSSGCVVNDYGCLLSYIKCTTLKGVLANVMYISNAPPNSTHLVSRETRVYARTYVNAIQYYEFCVTVYTHITRGLTIDNECEADVCVLVEAKVDTDLALIVSIHSLRTSPH